LLLWEPSSIDRQYKFGNHGLGRFSICLGLRNELNFVPCGAAEDNSTKGYIVSTVLGPNTKEVCIFDGENLAIGPVCKLSHPSLDFGFTIHTAWLPKIVKRTASYNIPVKQDYQPLVDRKSRQIREMFDKYVYPHFP
jgi:hypothetical protein